MKKIEQKLQAVYDYIRDFITDNGFPPTVREICSGLNISSTSLAYSYVNKLIELGKLEKGSNKNRAIGLVQHKSSYHPLQIPIVGVVSAGKGILAVENIEGYMPVPYKFFKGSELFLLKVSGDSMTEAGINDGNLVVVNKQSTAEEGDIVLALIDNLSTIKRFRKTKEGILLHPENSLMKDIMVPKDAEFSILGVVVGCMKTF
jgi:repressor LexA